MEEKLTELLTVGEDGVGCTGDGGSASLGTSDLVAGDDERSSSGKRDIDRAVAATLVAPGGDAALHGVLVAIDEQRLDGSCNRNAAVIVGVAETREETVDSAQDTSDSLVEDRGKSGEVGERQDTRALDGGGECRQACGVGVCSGYDRGGGGGGHFGRSNGGAGYVDAEKAIAVGNADIQVADLEAEERRGSCGHAAGNGEEGRGLHYCGGEC